MDHEGYELLPEMTVFRGSGEEVLAMVKSSPLVFQTAGGRTPHGALEALHRRFGLAWEPCACAGLFLGEGECFQLEVYWNRVTGEPGYAAWRERLGEGRPFRVARSRTPGRALAELRGAGVLGRS